jgi:hypothetical protein
MNLMLNGIEAMNDGWRADGHVTMDDGSVEISVSDTGVGLPAETLVRCSMPSSPRKHKGAALDIDQSHHHPVARGRIWPRERWPEQRSILIANCGRGNCHDWFERGTVYLHA